MDKKIPASRFKQKLGFSICLNIQIFSLYIKILHYSTILHRLTIQLEGRILKKEPVLKTQPRPGEIYLFH